jgi:glycosyltransferase involved in cell wall biosynthesis
MRATRALQAFGPEILHCHNFHGNILGRLLKLAFPRACVVSTIHNVYEGGWLRMAAYRMTDPLSRCTVAVCEAARTRMVDAGASPASKCSVIANGIDCVEFAPDRERRDAIRRQFGSQDKFVWIAVGRLVPAKGHENLLRAFELVRRENQLVELWIVGEGNRVYTECMQELAAELGLNDSIHWLGFRRDIATLLDAADAFVQASAWEGMPLAPGEAMAMEKPVVATDVGGVRELVGDGGILVHAMQPSLLAKAMLTVLHHGYPEDGGQAARQRAIKASW